MEAKDRLVKCEDSCPDAGTPQCNDCDYGAAFEEGAAVQDEISFKAGMEEEAKGGHNSISYLEGYQEGEKAGWEKGLREGIDYSNKRFKHKEAFKAGIKKVVDWVEQYHIKVLEGNPSDVPAIYSDCGYHIPPNILQAKLEEWG